jgi:ribonuclease III
MTVKGNAKGELLERLQEQGQDARFETRQRGPDHAPVFVASVVVGGQPLGQGEGPSRREAERVASLAALQALDGETAPVTFGSPEPTAPTIPVPIYSEVLREALLTAHERLDPAAPLTQVGREAAQLYRTLLNELGQT